jgi:DNA-binding MarR family transcriptional regulator
LVVPSISKKPKGSPDRRTALIQEPEWAEMVVVRALRLGDAIGARQAALFEQFGLTLLQYNVVRILYVRDPHGEGLPVGTIGNSLVVRSVDLTRLLDRLEKNGNVERFRTTDDRRVVRIRLTRKGVDLVEKIHQPMLAYNRAMLSYLSSADLERLAGDLGRALDGLAPASGAKVSI